MLRLKETYKETYPARPQGAPADCAHGVSDARCLGDAHGLSDAHGVRDAREAEGEDCQAPTR